MMKLIQNIDVYAPQHLGKKDVLTINDKIVKIKDAGSISADGFLSEAEMINGEGLLLTPGFIDSHVHVLGGGGEGGFANRTPEATMEGLTKFGVTTVVGCLGTDGIGRDMCALVAKTKGLNEQGMSAYCYTGSYQIPVHTLTDSIVKDIMMIQEIIGTGEIAISDHRSSQPTFEEFARVVADTRLGGVLSGKAGIVNVHLGDSPRCLDLIERVVDETEIPASQILPTHINRNEMLFGKSIEYALKGGAVDFTGNEDIDYWETICDEVRVCNGIKRMLDAGVNPDRMTISSDGQGSLPMYSSDGEFLGMGVGQSSCLLKEVKECVFKADIPLEIALSTITSNPAEILRLKGKGKIEEIRQLAAQLDADGIVCDDELTPAQMKNLEQELGFNVLDRTMVILDIFASRARSSEGKIQIELAQLRYRANRLTGMGQSMSRLGGGIGTRGPGESKLETDRRLIHQRIGQLKSELEQVKRTREVTRKRRNDTHIPVAAIVGYTNAGKSSLLNKLTGSEVLAEDKLFATLDPTTRVLELSGRQQILVTDTVGFIRKLPHHLIEAFKSTLEEAKYADYILHVVDASNPQHEKQMLIVYETLANLDVKDKTVITLFNKQDARMDSEPLHDFKADHTLQISAKNGTGLEELKNLLSELLRENKILVERTVPYANAGVIQLVRKSGELLEEEYREDGIYIRAYVPMEIYAKL